MDSLGILTWYINHHIEIWRTILKKINDDTFFAVLQIQMEKKNEEE